MNKKEFFAKWTKLPGWSQEVIVVIPVITAIAALLFAAMAPPSDMAFELWVVVWLLPVVAVVAHALFVPEPRPQDIEEPLPPQPAPQAQATTRTQVAPPRHKGSPIAQGTITPRQGGKQT
jgi:hypothetical protein